jgi:ABC-type Mn2+/Zn2+ transport system permease subunit
MPAALDSLIDPLREQFMQRALLEMTLIAIPAGILGCWVLFYRAAYAAESLAHALFPGLVVAALVGIPLLAGGTPGIILAAIMIALIARVPGIEQDTAVAVVVTGLFGLGALLALSPASPPGIQGLLFGDILGASDTDLILAGSLALAVLVALRLLHGRLLVAGFDPGSARSLGVSPTLADAAVLVLLAATVLVAVQGLGNLLVVAVLIGPAATARLVTNRLVPMMATAVAIAIAAGVSGLYLSYYAGTAAGASIAGCLVGFYLLVAAAGALPEAAWRRASIG